MAVEYALSSVRLRSYPTLANLTATKLDPPGVWTNTAWTQVIAAGVTTARVILAGVSLGDTGTSNEWELDIGSGGAGAEVVVATMRAAGTLSGGSSNMQGHLYFPVPIDNIAQGARISWRGRSNNGGTLPRFGLLYYEVDGAVTFQTTTRPSVPIPSAANGIIRDTPAAAGWGNSTWIQITASTAYDLAIGGIILAAESVSTDQNSWEADLGKGAAASEVVIATIRGTSHTTGSYNPGGFHLFRPLLDNVPSGTRLAWRLRHSNAIDSSGFDDHMLSLLVYELPL